MLKKYVDGDDDVVNLTQIANRNLVYCVIRGSWHNERVRYKTMANRLYSEVENSGNGRHYNCTRIT